MPDVIFVPAAQAEYDHAVQWYHGRSPAAAISFEVAVERALAAIAASPEGWATVGKVHRRYLVDGFPYSIVYRATASAIIVVAVAHGSRRPGYWKRRT